MTHPFKSIPPSQSGRNIYEIIRQTAYRAGRLTLDKFYANPKTDFTFKGRADIVTAADHAAESIILNSLCSEYPTFNVLSEESNPKLVSPNSPFTWIVDPIDGSRNFAEGIPHFCCSIALACENETVLAITYDPAKNEVFHAELGNGAFLAATPLRSGKDAFQPGQPLHVSKRASVSEAIIGLDLGYVDQAAAQSLELLNNLWPAFQGVRIMGSAALGFAYAAAGRIDLYFHPTLAPWDSAAGLLLIRESGGVALDRQGRTAGIFTPDIIVSNPPLAAAFQQIAAPTEWGREYPPPRYP